MHQEHRDRASAANALEEHYLRMPHVEKGMAVGLYGGSFNPPHAGHALVANIAIKRLKLDQLWWMITPGNPLKANSALAPLSHRVALSESVTPDPKIKVTAVEAGLGLTYTIDTLRLITARNPSVNFIWIMGADSLRDMHFWREWDAIVNLMPIAVIDRPGASFTALASRMAQRYASAQVPQSQASQLAHYKAPAWTFLRGPRSPLSSTILRASA